MVLQYYAFYLYYVRKALLKLCEDASPVAQSVPSHFLNHIVTTSQHQARTFAPVNK